MMSMPTILEGVRDGAEGTPCAVLARAAEAVASFEKQKAQKGVGGDVVLSAFCGARWEKRNSGASLYLLQVRLGRDSGSRSSVGTASDTRSPRITYATATTSSVSRWSSDTRRSRHAKLPAPADGGPQRRPPERVDSQASADPKSSFKPARRGGIFFAGHVRYDSDSLHRRDSLATHYDYSPQRGSSSESCGVLGHSPPTRFLDRDRSG